MPLYPEKDSDSGIAIINEYNANFSPRAYF